MERLSGHRVDVVWRCGRRMVEECCVACGKRATAGLRGGCRRQAGRSAKTKTHTREY
jgi:hypothetical protein